MSANTQPTPRFSPKLFARLPPELRLEIFEECGQNDLVCLSLTCHTFRSLTLPFIKHKISLTSYDQARPPKSIKCACGNAEITGVVQDKYMHRRKLHSYGVKGNYDTTCVKCRQYYKGQYSEDHAMWIDGGAQVLPSMPQVHLTADERKVQRQM
ncbi:hypothetical protein C8034_v008853 [Colletotrichum sidae]|uniref:F-box domain-containing protein n=1 Tax=Colletotrichum sidae TaxID=1347389 RepID=A0A4R8TMT6_9PEZI|nr:hypothetical protein C8034_v008853 [Colletotrichum sidae]